MPAEGRDAAHLWDMREAARAALGFVRGRTLDDYRKDLLLRSAVERQLELLGEAAGRISDAFRAAHPEIPLRRITGLRNALAHEYDEIDDERVWRVATDHLPGLVGRLDFLIPRPPGETQAP